jgi:hypothetical protein
MAATKPRDQVEQAWLDAGRKGDVKTLRSLRKTHPKWLALDRVRSFPVRRGAASGCSATLVRCRPRPIDLPCLVCD